MQSPSSQSDPVKKQEEDDKLEKREVKPLPKTLNRVPRACNACRKQKMRCEGAESPPCRRCRHTGLECLFEKPSREATLTGEAGLERIRSLENHVAEISRTQLVISEKLSEVLHHVRSGGPNANRSPSAPAFPSFPKSPNSSKSPSLSAQNVAAQHASPPSATTPFTAMHSLPPPKHRSSLPVSGYQGSSSNQSIGPDDHLAPLYSNYQGGPGYNVHTSSAQGPVLPPFSSIQSMAPPLTQNNISSMRYQSGEQNYTKGANKYPSSTSTKRQALSNVPSADSSDVEEEDNGELPASGLVAPWEVLRGLADVAIERATKNGDASEPHSRARTPSPDRHPHTRPSKRRKLRHKLPQPVTFQNVVTKGIITEAEARELFNLFYHGCSTFLPVFDSATDTYNALHERSPFAVDAICMVAARVRDGGATTPSEVHRSCLDEVQKISQATLFAPVLHCEAVQAMILVSGWSDNGWLSGGHAVRMAMELSLHKAWPKLLKRLNQNKIDLEDDKKLVIMSRTWFCLYLFEHQLSYGTGRPAVLKDDESIRDARLLVSHPLAIEDDMRLVSTVELIAIRERVHNALAPYEGPVPPHHFDELDTADHDFKQWHAWWDIEFSKKYEDAAFYRQSLQIQHLHAELFHNATALRGIDGPEDVENMPPNQRELARRSIEIARQGLDITVNSPSYREGMKYAVHYTHATATFAASFLLRLSRLFPDDCDIVEVRDQVERLVTLLSDIPAKRYALTLQLMLKRSKRRVTNPNRSPHVIREPQRTSANLSHSTSIGHSTSIPQQYGRTLDSYSTYEPSYPPQDIQMHGTQSTHGSHLIHPTVNPATQQYMAQLPHGIGFTEAEILRGLETTEANQLPVWISDQSLGGQSFPQHGMDAFLIPTEYLPTSTQIW